VTSPNLDRHLGFLLHDVARLSRKRIEQRMRTLGLTRAQWSVLAHIARNEGIKQNALAAILEVEPITLARILDRLQAAGFIERRPHPEDRRAWLPHLTAKAHPVLDQLFAHGAATREEALAGFSAEEREELIELLLRMKSNLCDNAAPKEFAPASAGPASTKVEVKTVESVKVHHG
jgi:DNA-binding MarR family transcriptional regulator